MRPEAEASGYLKARAKQQQKQIPKGNDRKKGEGKRQEQGK
jgi:hypothetical protein